MLAERGAHVIVIDGNAELLAVARSRGIVNAEFRDGDVRTPNLDGPVHGIWSSFTALFSDRKMSLQEAGEGSCGQEGL